VHLQAVADGEAIAGKRNFLHDPVGKIGRRQLLHRGRLALPPRRGKG